MFKLVFYTKCPTQVLQNVDRVLSTK